MKRRWAYLFVLGPLVVGGILATLGTSDPDVDFSAPLAVLGRVVRDVDQVGLKVTRVSADQEMAVGGRVAQAVATWSVRNQDWARYVAAVGVGLTPHARRTAITYTFTAIDSTDVNAFALPGGYVFVTTGLLEFVESEAELAHILGHEIAHVDLRHCIERYQYQLKLAKFGLDSMPASLLLDIGRSLVTSAYSKEQELEADAQGLRMLAQAGYDPSVGAAVFSRFGTRTGEKPPARARTPVGEVARAASGLVGAYFTSHPPSTERMERMSSFVARNQRRFSEERFYVGRQNHERRVPRSEQEFEEEWRQL